jgi:hypothetical protein
MSWQDILKKPYPNHWLPANRRGLDPSTGRTREIIRGTGPAGSFLFDELDKVSPEAVIEVIDRYKVKTQDDIKAAKKAGKPTKHIEEENRKQMENNVYATSYGMGGKGWFRGGFRRLGYNPDDAEHMRTMKRKIGYVMNQRWLGKDPPEPKPKPEPEPEPEKETEEEEAVEEPKKPAWTEGLKPNPQKPDKDWRKRLPDMSRRKRR